MSKGWTIGVVKTLEELWKNIPDFSNYDVSNLGRIYNRQSDTIMRTSLTNHGHVKISLVSEWDKRRYTRSVGLLVAEAFVRRPNAMCDSLIELDGNLSNVSASNLAWRPKGFAWSYAHQLKVKQPIYFNNLPVCNITDGVEYKSIIDAGMNEGLLFQDIWESTYSGRRVYPTGCVFEVVDLDVYR